MDASSGPLAKGGAGGFGVGTGQGGVGGPEHAIDASADTALIAPSGTGVDALADASTTVATGGVRGTGGGVAVGGTLGGGGGLSGMGGVSGVGGGATQAGGTSGSKDAGAQSGSGGAGQDGDASMDTPIVSTGGTGVDAQAEAAAAVGTGGILGTGGVGATGGILGTGGVTGGTGGTGGMGGDPSVCAAAVGGAVEVSCGGPGTPCSLATTYTVSSYSPTYCAEDGACAACTPTLGACSTTDCRDCCSGVSSDGSCIASCTANSVKCFGHDCKDCCSGLSSEGTCVQCNRNSDCTCPGLCSDHKCACTPTNTKCARPDMGCFDCCGTYFHNNDQLLGDNVCGCSLAGEQCSRADCYDCCNHLSSIPQNVCSCTAAGNACLRSDCADCCYGRTSSGRCVGAQSAVTFASGKAVGAMTGYGWVALGSSDLITDPTCGGTAITNSNPCSSSTTWSSTTALCVTGSLPALTATPDYTNNWGIAIGVNSADPAGGVLGQTYEFVAITVTGSPTSGLLAIAHRKGDAEATTYCAALTPGSAIAFTSFNTKCYDSPPDGIYMAAADVPNIDEIRVQVSSSTSAVTVTNFCITGITFTK